MAKRGFDRIAAFYDTLAYVVFGETISKSAEQFLTHVSGCKHILILGGGTGRFLPKLLELSDAEIWFIDSSEKMTERARKKIRDARVHFVTGTEQAIPSEKCFDAVLTFFFLDLFSDQNLPAVIRHIKKFLSYDAHWLAADFVDNRKWWQHPLLRAMYFFFFITTGLKTSRLPRWQDRLRDAGFLIFAVKSWKSGFVQSVVCKGISPTTG